MKIITIREPYAGLIAHGFKSFETRSKAINYRGPLLIHAANRTPKHGEWTAMFAQVEKLTGEHPSPTWFHFGCVVAIADVVSCQPMHNNPHPSGQTYDGSLRPYIAISAQTELERAVGEWAPGRYAWKLSNIRRLDTPIPWTGRQGLSPAPDELISSADMLKASQVILAPVVLQGVGS